MSYDATVPHPNAPPPPSDVPRPIAHWSHSLALLLVLSLTTLYGHAKVANAQPGNPHLGSYAGSIVLEWLLLGSVIAGIYRRRDFFLTAFRNRANSLAQSLGIGLMVYIMGFVALIAVGLALVNTPLYKHRNEAYILAMLPHSPIEFSVWFLLSLSAGACEELIFRGYLLQQLTSWTRRPVASIFIAALLFGSVHLYEGLGAILPLTALAVVYGFVVRHYKGDLRGVIVAHTLQDFLVALLALAKPLLDHYQPK